MYVTDEHGTKIDVEIEMVNPKFNQFCLSLILIAKRRSLLLTSPF